MFRRGVAVATPQPEPGHDQHDAEGEEAEIPPERVGDVVADVMDREDVVVDDTLDQV